MSIIIDIQHATNQPLPLSDEAIESIIKTTLTSLDTAGELTLRIVEPDEIQNLNRTYRMQDKPTNVLAFVSEYPDFVELETPLLGDLFICPQVLDSEATQFNKDAASHYTHILIHGVLHLLGYDHIKDDEAEIMQQLEIKLLAQFNISNPYLNWESEIE